MKWRNLNRNNSRGQKQEPPPSSSSNNSGGSFFRRPRRGSGDGGDPPGESPFYADDQQDSPTRIRPAVVEEDHPSDAAAAAAAAASNPSEPDTAIPALSAPTRAKPRATTTTRAAARAKAQRPTSPDSSSLSSLTVSVLSSSVAAPEPAPAPAPAVSAAGPTPIAIAATKPAAPAVSAPVPLSEAKPKATTKLMRPKAEATPDLSNLWSRKKGGAGQLPPPYNNTQNDARHNRSAADAVPLYPTVMEDEVTLPDTEELLRHAKQKRKQQLLASSQDSKDNNNNNNNNKMPPPQPLTTEKKEDAPKESITGAKTITNSAKPTTKPGAVAVTGAGGIVVAARELQKADDVDDNDKTQPAATAAPLFGRKPAGTTSLLGSVATENKPTQQISQASTKTKASSLSLLDDDDEDDDDRNDRGDGFDSGVNKQEKGMPNSNIAAGLFAAAAPASSSNKPKSLDDDDDDEDGGEDDSNQRPNAAATVATSIPTSLVKLQGSSVLSTSLDSLGSAAKQSGKSASPVLWGRKAPKATLEDDQPDDQELAFAEGAVAPLPTTNIGMQSSMKEIEPEPRSPPPPPPVAAAKLPRPQTEESMEDSVATGPPAAAVAKPPPGHAFTSPSSPTSNNNKENNKSKSKMSEDEVLRAVLEESRKTAIEDSSRQLELQQQQQNGRGSVVVLTASDMEEMRENSRSLRSMLAGVDTIDVGFLQTVLDLCRENQRRVARGIHDATTEESAGETDFEALIELNNNLLDAVEAAGKIVEDNRKPAPRQRKSNRSNVSTSSNTNNLDVQDLVDKRDIFSLICMLRVHQNEKRLDAALALLKFARAAVRDDNAESVALRDEIRSSGGLYTLLRLFGTRGIRYELRVVTALAVAFVLPSFVEPQSLSASPSLGLKIVECLRFLSTAQSVSHNGEFLSADEHFDAAGMALTSFWVIHLEPVLRSKKSLAEGIAGIGVPASKLSRQRSRGGAVPRSSAIFDKLRQEAIAGDELLEMTVTLIIHLAKHETDDTTGTTTAKVAAIRESTSVVDASLSTPLAQSPSTPSPSSPFKWSHHLIEQVCALENARPVAVRNGILQILVTWIRSAERERIRSAASSLRYLTSVNDKYMAGWIHSEMINKGAIKALGALQNISVTHDVRLAIAQILSSLCAAPHTRAAVLEANCFNFLIGVLYEHNADPSTEDLALFAGSAVLQLAAGAIARASAFSNTDHDDVLGLSTSDRRDSLIGDIVESGVISSFVSIAKTAKNKKLRSVAVQALRVLSEDVSPARQTRLHLCEYGTAMALGVTLKEDIALLGDELRNEAELSGELQYSLFDLHESLCALSNILEPDQEGTPVMTKAVRDVSSSSFKDPQHLLIKGCLETANSGGLKTLLRIANLPFQLNDTDSRNVVLLEEACRSLSSMAPLLLTSKVASAGYSKFAYDVMLALHNVLEQVSREESENRSEMTADLLLSVLQGMSALSRSEPLKVRIIDMSLPYLLQAKNSQYQSDIAMVATQAFQSLNLADDEIAAQVAGNAPNVFAEWFCLQRSLLIQAMARDELRRLIQMVWDAPFQEASHGSSKLMHDSRVASLSSIGDDQDVLFACFADDSDTATKRDSLLTQYKDMYEARYEDGSLPLNGSWKDTEKGLLSQQTYPLNSRETETKWILEHRRSVTSADPDKRTSSSGRLLSEHVEKMLGVYFPSSLLRDSLIPIFLLRPESSFNFRALMMAQRRYFSFRREGQLLAVLCDREADSLGSEDIHWTLGFTNSSFAGEFAESLVQILYKCPVICNLSFVRNTDWKDDVEDASSRDGSGILLANLVGSLPPWISHLTFEGFFNGNSLTALVDVFETKGELITGNDGLVGHNLSSTNAKFQFFAIRRSPNIQAGAWLQFFNLLGGDFNVPSGPSMHPLAFLKALDLSDNRLGDELCADLLEVVYGRESGCKLEDLDLSGNEIFNGTRVLRVLRTYYNKQKSGTGSVKGGGKSTLKNLRLRSNALHVEKAWLEIIMLLQGDGLGLQELDLSANEIAIGRAEFEVADIVVQTLMGCSFIHRVNLSNNHFGTGFIDRLIQQLAKKYNGLATVQVEGNSPLLTPLQVSTMNEIVLKTRKRVLDHYFQERNHQRQSKAPTSIVAFAKYQHDGLTAISIDEDKAVEHFSAKFPKARSAKTSVDNSITVLFSAPLVFTDGHNLRPFAKLDFDMERELMWQCLKEASRDISLSFDSATHDRLLACMTKRCSCLHYSGHGHQQYLPFEDGSGGPYWFKVDQFKSLIEREGGAPFRFVFVSACYSYLAGETFASAGVPHVVCCQQESELKDTAALAFTRQFYLALAVGHTVKASFEQGCKAVRATPNLRDPNAEMEKFLLLPADGDHNVPIFDAEPVADWPRPHKEETGNRGGRRLSSRSSTKISIGGAKSSELSVRNMMQEDPSPSPPEFFVGREVDMYYVLKAVLAKRFVSVIGETGVGRSSLVCALCHYINERATTMIGIDHIYFVKASQKRKRNPFRSLVQRFLKKLVEEKKLPSLDPEAEMETMFDAICRYLKHDKALVVFDRVELVVNADDANDFPMLLSKLCRETKNIKVLVTNRQSLGIPSLGEHHIELGPLNFADTVRLFANLCPYLHTPADRRKMFESLVRDEEKAQLLATDPGIGESAKRIFSILGDGLPSRIEKAAYDLSKEEFLQLYKATTTEDKNS